jgi:signal transduction histidine kinase
MTTSSEETGRGLDLSTRDELDRMKDDFLATVSHELRTPLTSIKGSAQTILARGDKLTAEEHEAFLQAIVRQCERLSSMVDTLLLVSRVEADQVPEHANYILLKDLLAGAAEAAGGCERIRMEVGGPPGLVTDQFRAHHVLRNLIENACKYSPHDAPVLVKCDGTEKEVSIVVLDQGAGIPEGSEQEVFDRFKRIEDSSTPTIAGTGLGLYIARRFAREIGGEIEVGRGTHAPWTGARFALRIPGLGDRRGSPGSAFG